LNPRPTTIENDQDIHCTTEKQQIPVIESMICHTRELAGTPLYRPEWPVPYFILRLCAFEY